LAAVLLLLLSACGAQREALPTQPTHARLSDFTNQDLIDQLEIDKFNFAAQARATIGAHQAIRLMKIHQLDEMIDQLKLGRRPTPKQLADAERLTPEPLWQFGWY
jgi:hypothetical protein